MPHFLFEDRSADCIAMVVTMVIANIIIDGHDLKGLDVEIELEDGVASGGCMLVVEISTGTVDDLSAPLDRIARTALVCLDEMISRMDEDVIGDERVASFGCQQQVRCIDDDIVLLDPPIGRRGVELDGIAEIVTMRIAEDIHVCLFARVVVADVKRDGIVITRSDTQGEVIDRVAVMDGVVHERVPISSVRLEHLITRQRIFYFRSGVMLALPRDGIIIAYLNRVVEIIRRIQSQAQDVHGVATALSVAVLHGALLRLERIDIDVGLVADTLGRDLIAHDITLALHIPYTYVSLPCIIGLGSVTCGLAGSTVFGELISAVHRDPVHDSTVATIDGLVNISCVKTEIGSIARNTDAGNACRFVLVFGAVDNMLVEMNRVIVAHRALGSVHRREIDCIDMQAEAVDRVTAVDRMEINGIGIIPGMIGRHGCDPAVLIVVDRVLVIVRPDEVLKLADGHGCILMIIGIDMQVQPPCTIATERVGVEVVEVIEITCCLNRNSERGDALTRLLVIDSTSFAVVPLESTAVHLTHIDKGVELIGRSTEKIEHIDRVVAQSGLVCLLVGQMVVRRRQFALGDDLTGELIAVLVVTFPAIRVLGGAEEIIRHIAIDATYLQHQIADTIALIAIHRFGLHVRCVFDNTALHRTVLVLTHRSGIFGTVEEDRIAGCPEVRHLFGHLRLVGKGITGQYPHTQGIDCVAPAVVIPADRARCIGRENAERVVMEADPIDCVFGVLADGSIGEEIELGSGLVLYADMIDRVASVPLGGTTVVIVAGLPQDTYSAVLVKVTCPLEITMDSILLHRIVLEFAPFDRVFFEMIGCREEGGLDDERVAAQHAMITFRAGMGVHRIDESMRFGAEGGIIDGLVLSHDAGLCIIMDRPCTRAFAVLVQTHGVVHLNQVRGVQDQMEEIRGVAPVEGSAAFVAELTDRRIQLALAGLGGKGQLEIDSVLFDRDRGVRTGFPVVAGAVPLAMIEGVLVGAQMDRIEILESVADEEHKGHHRVAPCLREIMTREGVVLTYLHLIDPWLEVLVSLSFLDADELRCRRVGTMKREIGLVIEAVVEETQGVSDADDAVEGIIEDPRHAHGGLERVYILSFAHQARAVEDGL